MLSHVQLFVTSCTVACQAPLSIGFSRQEYWDQFPFPPPGDLPNPGVEPKSLESLVLAGRFFTTVQPGKPVKQIYPNLKKKKAKKKKKQNHIFAFFYNCVLKYNWMSSGNFILLKILMQHYILSKDFTRKSLSKVSQR